MTSHAGAEAAPREISDVLISHREVCRQCGGVTTRTTHRWRADQRLGFPEPVEINGRLYWRQSGLDAWKQSRSARSGRG